MPRPVVPRHFLQFLQAVACPLKFSRRYVYPCGTLAKNKIGGCQMSLCLGFIYRRVRKRQSLLTIPYVVLGKCQPDLAGDERVDSSVIQVGASGNRRAVLQERLEPL